MRKQRERNSRARGFVCTVTKSGRNRASRFFTRPHHGRLTGAGCLPAGVLCQPARRTLSDAVRMRCEVMGLHLFLLAERMPVC